MRFSTILALPVILAVSALAGHNCKCQDSAGQYNGDTEYCCTLQKGQYHKGDAHQCTSLGGGNALNSGMFVDCCVRVGHGGAYCWA